MRACLKTKTKHYNNNTDKPQSRITTIKIWGVALSSGQVQKCMQHNVFRPLLSAPSPGSALLCSALKPRQLSRFQALFSRREGALNMQPRATAVPLLPSVLLLWCTISAWVSGTLGPSRNCPNSAFPSQTTCSAWFLPECWGSDPRKEVQAQGPCGAVRPGQPTGFIWPASLSVMSPQVKTFPKPHLLSPSLLLVSFLVLGRAPGPTLGAD